MIKLLFQGDSITDADRFFYPKGKGLGCGYVSMIADYFKEIGEEVSVLNKGISGDTVYNLKSRWQEDCIDLNPDVVTILIGINDVWEQMDSTIVHTALEFEKTYDDLLRMITTKTNAKIILMEPYVLPYPADRIHWRPLLDPNIQVVRKLAKKYQAKLIPLDGIINKAAIESDYLDIASDGAHLTQKGHEIVKTEWIKTYQTMK